MSVWKELVSMAGDAPRETRPRVRLPEGLKPRRGCAVREGGLPVNDRENWEPVSQGGFGWGWGPLLGTHLGSPPALAPGPKSHSGVQGAPWAPSPQPPQPQDRPPPGGNATLIPTPKKKKELSWSVLKPALF